MNRQQPPRRVPKINFRVLIIGRANAGKTSILQRVCDTTDSPIIYRRKGWRNERITLNPSIDRGEHSIDDELVFSNHKGYIFHDSRGIESASTTELEILNGFIQRKCGERRLRDRLHAIWFCVPMDNQRPELDLRFFKGICPDQNVPVIAVFTKYDQFRRNVQINVEDFGSPEDDVSQETEKRFQEHYLRPLGEGVRFVRLQKMHIKNMRCKELIEATAAALNDETTALMLLSIQRSNLELSVKMALNRVQTRTGNDSEVEDIVWECLAPFPYMWHWSSEPLPEYEDLELPFLGEDLGEDFLPGFLHGRLREESLSHLMSLPTITNLTVSGTHLGRYHLALAVVIILKNATLLRLSNSSTKSALAHAELDYRVANIDSKIRQHLTTLSSQEHSVVLFASFIMATDVCEKICAPTRPCFTCLRYSAEQYSPSILYSYWS